MRWVLIALLATTLLPAKASASDGQNDAGARYRAHRFSLGSQVAPFGGPTGIMGAVGDVALIPELSVTGGFGLGLASLQWALGLRPRLPFTAAAAFSVTVAYSHGDYKPISLGEPLGLLYPNGSWLNADFGVDVRFECGFFLRPFVGVSKLFHSSQPVFLPREAICGSFCSVDRQERWPMLPYFGLAFGGSF